MRWRTHRALLGRDGEKTVKVQLGVCTEGIRHGDLTLCRHRRSVSYITLELCNNLLGTQKGKA